MQRCPLPDFPWHRIEATQRFITDLFAGPPPPRPGVLMHLASPIEPPTPPPGLTAFQREVWNATHALSGRPLGADDWVPALGTSAGTCAMATAFFQNYREFMDHCLEGWRPGLRLFIHPCSVMYLPAQAREIPFNQAEVEQALAAIPGFTPARGIA
jgi:hypothetical protein